MAEQGAFKFTIEHANWLAHALQGGGMTPRLRGKAEWATLEAFARAHIEDDYYRFSPSIGQLARILSSQGSEGSARNLEPALRCLRHYYTQISWTCLILPSGNHAASDRVLTDPKFLWEISSFLPYPAPAYGLTLHLDEAPAQEIMLEYVFPAFKAALAQVTRWPGLLIWDRSGSAFFFELSTDILAIKDRIRWVFSELAPMGSFPDLLALKKKFSNEVLDHDDASSQVRIVHLSDLHLGSDVARQRLARVEELIEQAISELDGQAPIVPVITGDLVDDPSENSLGDLRVLMKFLNNMHVEKPVVVLGNHDVRKHGVLGKRQKEAVNIPREPMVWMDEHAVGIACFNSVNAGRLARGFIGANELAHVGNAIDRCPGKADFTLVAALHHHPIPVKLPSWYQRSWYERLLGYNYFERTEALEDRELFLNWLHMRCIPAVLHGHRHIPRFSKQENLAVIGCGSTVGNVKTTAFGETYISFNVVTIDRARALIGVRLRAERVPGAGLVVDEHETHEIVGRAPC